MRNTVLHFVILTILLQKSDSKSIKNLDIGINVDEIENGTTYKLTSMSDGLVITVLPDGTVVSDEWKGLEEQKWTIFEHPSDIFAVLFVNYAVPFNDFSGYEKLEGETRPIFPNPLYLNNHRIMADLKKNVIVGNEEDVPWQILVDNRWCLQNVGQCEPFVPYECEIDPAPYQFWELEIVQ
ncbi:uncharacterized protein LOC110863680 [Folsomia candida]|uniref:Ricin B lectin domain-containing protein n=1 Tax=Folsomia candida TaxID=158441 RepID=A0A226F1W2_FOLCA|nr:uncharacterized protein LOC110863680 [Folsomia candida]OXA63191.1 hypothetical protein Fcan01_00182 [Folsomia candida]